MTTPKAPFSSSPVGITKPLLKFSLDESLMMNDLMERFEKSVFVEQLEEGDETEAGVHTWKKEEMISALKQLKILEASIFGETGIQSVGNGEEDLTSASLAEICALLNPAELTPGGIALQAALRNHRLLEKQKLLETLKCQIEEVTLERQKVKRGMQDVKKQVLAMDRKIQTYQEEMSAIGLTELAALSLSCQIEIDNEREIFNRIKTMESICSKDKIDKTVADIKTLIQTADGLSKDVAFSKELPPDIFEIRNMVEKRKKQFQEVCDKVEDLMEYR